ncbi:MAG: hypothetical protein CMJ23_08935 [Phycisphaerae bacterium]|nr:hypothetical protein [Phycisphaerae bacterium]
MVALDSIPVLGFRFSYSHFSGFGFSRPSDGSPVAGGASVLKFSSERPGSAGFHRCADLPPAVL